eukprot:Protomagalhaensia_sp_Gyna_25__2521@NODE_2420_length_1095_cov_80_477273_g2003_i0_p1_GENE_NODE_2420_length_1095_cov_80_477273_g2003_i0NODE_2420_length_1095_cov_80_477273_g2003_i0_p1_ORF_typecomplete_len214_score30_52EMP24_GP25L/PF01105_24/2_2e23THOC2_N/PF16134_5/0_06_NODE_2420_length_1095_cov_80_477273_g2003_i0170811
MVCLLTSIALWLLHTQAIRVALFANEEECIGIKALSETEVIVNYEAFPGEDSRVKVSIDRQQLDLRTGKVLLGWENARRVPAWNHGRLNLTADVYKEHRTALNVCFTNTVKSRMIDLAFTIRADQYEELHDVATQDHTIGLLNSVAELSKETHKLFEQQHFSLVREESQRKAIRNVHSKMLWWSFAQALVLTIVTVTQVAHLRRMFQGPKLLL